MNSCFFIYTRLVFTLFCLLLLTCNYSFAQSCTCENFLIVNDPSEEVVHKFILDSNGSIIGEVGQPGTWIAQNTILNPHGVTQDPNGDIYISQIDQSDGVTPKLFKVDCAGNIISETEYGQPTFNRMFNIIVIDKILYATALPEPNNGLEDYGVYAWDACTGEQVGFIEPIDPISPGDDAIPWGLTLGTDGFLYATTSFGASGTNNVVYQIPLDLSSATPIITLPGNATSNSTFGVVQDEFFNLYFVVTQGGGTGSTTVYKYDQNGNLIDSITDPVLDQNGFGGAWGISYNQPTSTLYLGTLGDDCVHVLNSGGQNGTMSSIPGAGVGYVPDTYSKAIGVVEECCPNETSSVVDTTFCNATVNDIFFLQDLIGCDGIICEGGWSDDPSNSTVRFDPCDNSIEVLEDGCGTFTLNSTGAGFARCGSFDITVNACFYSATLNAPEISVTDNDCATDALGTFNVVSACGNGETLEWSTDGGATWSATIPTYDPVNTVTATARCIYNNDCISPEALVPAISAPEECCPPVSCVTDFGEFTVTKRRP